MAGMIKQHYDPHRLVAQDGALKAQTAVRVRLGALLYTGVRKAVTVEWT